ncbi:MAG TPA: hypothetical protein VG537_04960 [Candidatus Kapabacteria bacterium]|jgi:hypothetical protein|nr:hypothetical protein [Candidatus Kapabacteria bacterium]
MLTKRLLYSLLFLVPAAFIWSTSHSSPEKIYLIATPAAVTLPNAAAVDTVSFRLSCGCPFQLANIQAGGDTSAFMMTYITPLGLHTTPHRMAIQSKPMHKGNHAAWMIYSTVDHNGVTDYDTLHMSAIVR